MKNIRSTRQLNLPFRALFWLLIVMIILQVFLGLYAYNIIGQSYEGSKDMNVIGSLRMLIQRINSSTVTLSSGLSSQGTYRQLQTDIQRADLIISGLKKGDSSLRIRPLTDIRELELLNTLENEWVAYIESVEYLANNGSQLPLEERQSLVLELSFQADAMVLSINDLIVMEQERNKESLQILTIFFLVGGILSTILIILFWYLFLQRGFIKPLSNLLPALEAVMQGDAKIRVPEEGSQSTRTIATNYNLLAQNIQDSYVGISRDLSSILTLNNRLSYLSRELLSDSIKSYPQVNQTDSSPDMIALEQTASTNNTRTDSLTLEIINILAKQSLYTEELRNKQVFLEPSLNDEDLIDLQIADLEMRRQRAHLYALGYGESKNIGTCRLDQWQEKKGKQIFAKHPRFESLLEHHHRFHLALDDVLESINTNQIQQLEEHLCRMDNFTELAIIDLQHLKAACH